MPSIKGRISDIEVLRGIAILFVLVQHAQINLFPWMIDGTSRLYSYFGFGTGVDLFFAISGFVIARGLLPALESRPDATGFFNSTLAFWVRRAWRLLPSAWLWLAIILVLAVGFNRSGAFGTFRANFEATIAAILDIANFRFALVFFRFEPGVSFPYWSLSLEEQFYIALPFLVFVSRRRLALVLAAIVLAQFFITRSGPETTALGMTMAVVRSDALSIGVLIALWARHPTYRLFEPLIMKNKTVIQLAVLGLLLVCLAALGSPVLHLVSFQVGMVALLSALLVLIASFDGDYLFPEGIVKRVMLWIGSRSYALYLIHIPVYCLTRELWFRAEPAGRLFTSDDTMRFALTAALLMITLAELNYRFVETPLRRRGSRIADRLDRRVVEIAGSLR